MRRAAVAALAWVTATIVVTPLQTVILVGMVAAVAGGACATDAVMRRLTEAKRAHR